MAVTEAVLVLRDGRVFRGEPLGAVGRRPARSSSTPPCPGYQEILTDPSYRGQIVTMTYPMIGNYGLNDEDVESRRPWANGLIVKEASACPSSWRGRVSLDAYLKTHGIVGLQAIDTRALTRHLRDHGSQDGIISSGGPRRSTACVSACSALPAHRRPRPREARSPSTGRHGWSEGEWDLGRGYIDAAGAALQGGRLRRRHQAEHPAPAPHGRLRGDRGAGLHDDRGRARAQARRRLSLQRARRSGGRAVPGRVGARPAGQACRCSASASATRSSGLAAGGRTYKLPFGHHGANHPVRDLATGRSRDHLAEPQLRRRPGLGGRRPAGSRRT